MLEHLLHFWKLEKVSETLIHPNGVGLIHLAKPIFRPWSRSTTVLYQPPDSEHGYKIEHDELEEMLPELTKATTVIETMALIRKTRNYQE